MTLSSTGAEPALTAPFARLPNALIGANASSALAAAWGDYDNDGWEDLFISNLEPSGRDWLYHNNRDGTLTLVQMSPVTTDTSENTWSAAWADYDNDGWLDLVIGSQNGRSPNRVYRNVGGAFTRATEDDIGSLAVDIPQTLGVTWADFDQDGHLDLFVGNGTLTGTYLDFLYRNNGSGGFERVWDVPMVEPVKASSLGSWSDYDSDGDMDLLVTHTRGVGNSLFRNDGAGAFSEVTDVAGLGEDFSESVGAAWGDMDNDGDLDLFVTNVRLLGANTKNNFYRNNGNGTFEAVREGVIAEDEDHFVSGTWVDYDHDGWLDLFVTVTGQNGPGSKMRLYRNERNGTFKKVTKGALVEDTGHFGAGAWADYDHDGFLDVLVTYGSVYAKERSVMYRNTGNTNHWIKMRCVGTVSNRSAIGTKIRVKTRVQDTELWQMRQITGSEGWLSGNSLDTVIGLGTATNIEVLRIEWPSGIIQELRNVTPNQAITLVERTILGMELKSDGSLTMKVEGPRQQQYRVESSADLMIWRSYGSLLNTGTEGMASVQYRPLHDSITQFFRVVAD